MHKRGRLNCKKRTLEGQGLRQLVICTLILRTCSSWCAVTNCKCRVLALQTQGGNHRTWQALRHKRWRNCWFIHCIVSASVRSMYIREKNGTGYESMLSWMKLHPAARLANILLVLCNCTGVIGRATAGTADVTALPLYLGLLRVQLM